VSATAGLPPITVAAPTVGAEERALVEQVLSSGQLAQGPMVARLEELAAAMAGARHAVATSSGTDALELALETCDLRPGDVVVTTPFTFAATANAALRVGATVRFVDVGVDLTIDPDAVGEAIDERTRVVCPVHLYGQPARMGELETLAGRHGLRLVEDAAQAHGARCDGRPVGAADLGCFSLYATKNVTAGEGGLVTTDADEDADLLRVLRNQGMAGRYDYRAIGRNARMTDLQAAVAVPQLERLDQINGTRADNALLLTELLDGVDGLQRPVPVPGTQPVWHQYTVLLPEGHDRDEVVDAMAANGVFCGVYYPHALNDVPLYRDHPRVEAGCTPRARDAARRCLSLPVHHGLGGDEIERVAAALVSALER